MPDPRIDKLAQLLTRYSVKLKAGDTVAITGNAIAEPLILAVYREAIRCGAHVKTDIRLDGMSEIFFDLAKPKQLTWVDPFDRNLMRKVDARIGISGKQNTKALSGVDPKKMALAGKAQQPLTRIFMDRSASGSLRWVGTQWPCHASAQDAEMSLADYEDFVYGAGFLDEPDPVQVWKDISKSQQGLVRRLNRARSIRIVAEDTDLSYSCAGRTWINCDGDCNFPDGEVFTSPVEDSVEGHIRFSFPAVQGGQEVIGARLTFEHGRVVTAEADKGEDFLRAMVGMDKGSAYLGEAAIGTNYNITRFTRNTLFDEKIGGTVHLALGASFPETGGTNQSGLHWDMVCDLRPGGEVYADGELIQRNGRFLDKGYPKARRARKQRGK